MATGPGHHPASPPTPPVHPELRWPEGCVHDSAARGEAMRRGWRLLPLVCPHGMERRASSPRRAAPYTPPRLLPPLHPTSPPPEGPTGSPVDPRDGGSGELSGDFGGQSRAAAGDAWRRLARAGVGCGPMATAGRSRGGAARDEAEHGVQGRRDASGGLQPGAARGGCRRRPGAAWCVWPCEARRCPSPHLPWAICRRRAPTRLYMEHLLDPECFLRITEASGSMAMRS
ncbi:unnamed protein product [Urochloa humidicola]